jgi:pimeloyl-ACP methyl ester carboxylesterase
MLVFFHGIGDSHLNFECFFHERRLNNYDIVIGDILGHGYSSKSDSYSFHSQCVALKAQIDKVLKSGYEKVVFIPHSMGGACMQLICYQILFEYKHLV